MEFSNGLIGLFEVARAHGNDVKPPTTTLVLTDEGVTFDASEPVSIHYTLDGSRPTYASPMVSSAGLREGAAAIPLESGTTTAHWFSVDAAGNVESMYNPERRRQQLPQAGRDGRLTVGAAGAGEIGRTRGELRRIRLTGLHRPDAVGPHHFVVLVLDDVTVPHELAGVG